MSNLVDREQMNPFKELETLRTQLEKLQDELQELRLQAEGTAIPPTSGGQNPNRNTKSPQERAAYKIDAVQTRASYALLLYTELRTRLHKALDSYGQQGAKQFREYEIMYFRYMQRMSLLKAAEAAHVSYNTARGYNGKAVRAFLAYWPDNGGAEYEAVKMGIMNDQRTYFSQPTSPTA